MKTVPEGTENSGSYMPESFRLPKSIYKIGAGLLSLLSIVTTLSQLSVILFLLRTVTELDHILCGECSYMPSKTGSPFLCLQDKGSPHLSSALCQQHVVLISITVLWSGSKHEFQKGGGPPCRLMAYLCFKGALGNKDVVLGWPAGKPLSCV